MPDIEWTSTSATRRDDPLWTTSATARIAVRRRTFSAHIIARAAVPTRLAPRLPRHRGRPDRQGMPAHHGRDTRCGPVFDRNRGIRDGYATARALREMSPATRRPPGHRRGKGLEGLRRQDGIHAGRWSSPRSRSRYLRPAQARAVRTRRGRSSQYEMHGGGSGRGSSRWTFRAAHHFGRSKRDLVAKDRGTASVHRRVPSTTAQSSQV